MAVHALLFNFEQSRVCHRLAKLIWPWTLQGVMVGEVISVSERRVYVGDSLARVARTYQRSRQLNMRVARKKSCTVFCRLSRTQDAHRPKGKACNVRTTQVAAVYAYSDVNLGLVIMHDKNPIVICDMLYR